jgi:glycosyltransferase involved in cell wall biosynthesis
MRILLVNFEMNPQSQVLSWQYKVACELAKRCENIIVLTENMETCELPANMKVYVVPKLFIKAPLRLFGAKWLMNFPVFMLCRKYRFDACFIHMNMEWSYRLFPCLWFFSIPALLWYAHGTVSRRLKNAIYCSTRVITSTPEGCRIPSDKLKVIGQGIDVDLFNLQEVEEPQTDIISVGRISRRKRTDLLIDVMKHLKENQEGIIFRLILIGAPLNRNDMNYEQKLKNMVEENELADCVFFAGHVPQGQIPKYYRTAFLHINVSKTGSMDKTVLEALACSCPILTSNEAFFDLLKDYPSFIITDTSPETIANQVLQCYRNRQNLDRNNLRKLVIDQHSINSYINKLILNLEEIVKEKRKHGSKIQTFDKYI